MLKEELLTIRANLGELLGGLNKEQTKLIRDVRSNLLNLADFADNLERNLEAGPCSMLKEGSVLRGNCSIQGE